MKLRRFRRRELPLEGLQLQRVTNLNSYSAEDIWEDVVVVDEAQVTTSLVTGKPGTHKVVLDIDLPAKLIPSSTEGHFHLYIDHEVPHHKYMALLEALGDAGILEPGYVGASVERGFTAVRLPWVKKEILTS